MINSCVPSQPDLLTKKPAYSICLLNNKGSWLAALNGIVDRIWNVENFSDVREFENRLQEMPFGWGLIEFDNTQVNHHLQLVRSLTRTSKPEDSRRIELAIVGNDELSHDSRLVFERAFRTAGASVCYWDSDHCDLFVKRLERFESALPLQSITFKEYVYEKLPWQHMASGKNK